MKSRFIAMAYMMAGMTFYLDKYHDLRDQYNAPTSAGRSKRRRMVGLKLTPKQVKRRNKIKASRKARRNNRN